MAKTLCRTGEKPLLGGSGVYSKEWQVPACAEQSTAPVPSPEPSRPQHPPRTLQPRVPAHACPHTPKEEEGQGLLGKGRRGSNGTAGGVEATGWFS